MHCCSLFTGKEYANLQEVYEALQNREVKGMLIDAFTVGSKKELFNRRDLRISKLLDYSSAYGVALGDEAKKLQKCFQKYISEQRSDISKIVQDNVDTIEVIDGLHLTNFDVTAVIILCVGVQNHAVKCLLGN